MNTELEDREEVEQLTGHLNHQVVSPLVGLRSNMKLWSQAIDADLDKSTGSAREDLLAVSDTLKDESDELKGVIAAIQDLRAKFKTTADVTPWNVSESLNKRFSPVINRTFRTLQGLERSHRRVIKKYRADYELCRRMAAQADRLLKTVYSSSTEFKVDLSRLNFDNMLHLAFESARDAFEKRSIKYENLISFRNLSPAPSPIVFGDYTRLIELFVNLIDNSAKYSGKKDTLRISVTLSRTTGTAIKDLLRTQVESQWERFLLIEYCDNGIGIKPTERKLIFQKGERGLAGRSKRDEGLGYGLYYCRKVMHAHRGNIIYSNSLYCVGGKGSFFLYFPEFTSASQLEAPKITHQR